MKVGIGRKNVSVNLFSPKSIDNAIKEAERYKAWINKVVQAIVKELADMGVQVARVNFESAVYPGYNDTVVGCRVAADGKSATVFADGNAVLFIEFGTGILKPAAVDEEAELISGNILWHGEYGQGKGANLKGWIFKGTVNGNQPWDTYEFSDRPGIYRTFGNEANSSMWHAKLEVEQRINEAVRKAQEGIPL